MPGIDSQTPPDGPQTPPDGASQRTRLLLVGGITALLALLVGGVLLFAGGDEEHEFDPAPVACIEAWNGDPANLVLGQHQATAHAYSQVHVVRLTEAGGIAPGTDASSPCGVVFASSSLDTELAAAALIQRPKGWRPLSDTVTDTKLLSDLQLGAKEEYNALISPNGMIDAL